MRIERKYKIEMALAAAAGILVAVAVLVFVVGAGTYDIPGVGKVKCLVVKVGHLHRGDLALAEVGDSTYVVARVAARPGDTLDVVGGRVVVNGEMYKEPSNSVSSFVISREASYRIIHEIEREAGRCEAGDTIRLSLANIRGEWLRYLRTPLLKNMPDGRVYPYNPSTHWNAYNMGPIVMPKRGMTVDMTQAEGTVYKPLASADGDTTMTFERDYYWLLSDDRDVMRDSRSYGPFARPQLVGRLIVL